MRPLLLIVVAQIWLLSGVTVFVRSEEDSPITIVAYNHLLELVKDSKGNPNPRLTCTDGYQHAADYVAGQMQAIGLVPMGNLDRTSYYQTINGSVHETYCPPGISSLVGMVEGTRFPDHYVVWAAHLDGPVNDNPEYADPYELLNTSNAYDNGFAVALGLAMAEQMIQDPPATSVVFLFEAAEEIWYAGKKTHRCELYLDNALDWFLQIHRDAGLPTENIRELKCPHFGMGLSKWLNTPVIQHGQIKLMMFPDPLGTPYGFGRESDFLVAIGGELTSVTPVVVANSSLPAEGATLDQFLDLVWPHNTSSVEFLQTARTGVTYGSSYDVVALNYPVACGQYCVPAGGLPAVWLTQPAFQKYHGGDAVYVVTGLFSALADNGYAELLGNGTFPAPIYYSQDTIDSFYRPNLDGVATSLYQMTRTIADTVNDYTIQYEYKSPVGGPGRTYGAYNLTDNDMAHLLHAYEYMLVILEQERFLPPDVLDPLLEIIGTFQSQASFVAQADLSQPKIQENAKLLAQGVVAITLSLDFFNPNYPTKMLFQNQHYKVTEEEEESGEDITGNEEEDSLGSSSGSQRTRTTTPTTWFALWGVSLMTTTLAHSWITSR